MDCVGGRLTALRSHERMGVRHAGEVFREAMRREGMEIIIFAAEVGENPEHPEFGRVWVYHFTVNKPQFNGVKFGGEWQYVIKYPLAPQLEDSVPKWRESFEKWKRDSAAETACIIEVPAYEVKVKPDASEAEKQEAIRNTYRKVTGNEIPE